MSNSVLVKKQSGETEPFSEQKLRQSLERSGATAHNIQHIIDQVRGHLFEGITTREIYRIAFRLLRQSQRSTAARFSLKKAIMELGPTGYPFEHFIGEIMKGKGFVVQVGQILKGKCVSHEVDVVATHHHSHHLMECKFHNQQGKISNVQVPLYINSRFEDIRNIWQHLPGNAQKTFQGWVVTNTRFSADALEYGKCAGLHLVSWDYPRGNSLKEMIEQSGLFPITAITTLTLKQKQQLLAREIVLCRQLMDQPVALDELGIPAGKKNKILQEAKALVNQHVNT